MGKGGYLKLPKVSLVESDLSHFAEFSKQTGRMVNLYGRAIPQKAIVVLEKNQPANEYLDTIIHELLHVAMPRMSENNVGRLASWMAWEIWKSSLRRRIAENKENLK